MADDQDDEQLPAPDRLSPSKARRDDDLLPEKVWDRAGLSTALIIGMLPVLAELFFRGSDGPEVNAPLLNPSTVGYCFFAIGASATVQCAQNQLTRNWIGATLPSVLSGLILGLNYSDKHDAPDLTGWTLVAASGVFTALAMFIAWRPAHHA